VINNGVDTRRFAAGNGAALRSTWLDGSAGWRDLPPDRRILIGTVGRFVVAKNHRRLVDVLTMLQADPALAGYQLRLVLVGDGEGRCDLEAYVQQQGVQASVIFAGMRQDIPDVLDALDLFVLSSDREGHPLTALEAQAAGTPVVLTDAGGSCEAIAHEAGQSGGVLVEKTAEALTRAIREMILKPELRMQRGTFARSYALEHFDKQQMAQRYADIFLDIGGHSRG
jgi:glycosyltransferase involved in cell wall biosynthesis